MNKPNIKQHLRRAFFALAIVCALTAGALFALPKAQADQPTTLTQGGWTAGAQLLGDPRPVGPNLILAIKQIQPFTEASLGTGLAGTLCIPFEQDVVYFDRNGAFRGVTFHGSGTFTGSILGRARSGILMTLPSSRTWAPLTRKAMELGSG